MKIAHEAPTEIFNKVQELTDYDYALVHLLDENEAYRKKFFEAKEKGREIILDNSIFELGEAFDWESYIKWIKELKPDWYIVPDVLEDYSNTLLNYNYFSVAYAKELDGKPIGVIQGKDYTELSTCYQALASKPNIKMIGISFDYSYYEKVYPTLPKLQAWAAGRKHLIFKLIKEEFFDEKIPIHLLGCSLPQEFEFYNGLDFIYSVDTSNPVVHGLKGIRYTDRGLVDKESQKLFELIDSRVTEEQWLDIEFNVSKFRDFCNG